MNDLSFLAFDPALEATAENDLAQAFAGLLHRLHLEQGGAAAQAADVARAAFLVSAAAAAGHSCLELSELPGQAGLFDDGAEGEARRWRDLLGASPVVALAEGGDPCRPLVLEGGRLYLYRYWRYEKVLAQRLAALNSPLPQDDESLAQLLDHYFPPTEVQPDWQKIAAATALTRRLAVISGGPGTGKTTTVVKLLAILLSLAPAARVALAAPTGKAAARMLEAVRSQCQRLELGQALRRRFPEAAFTLHRLLGAVPGRVRPRHDREHPLPYDVVIVDEASMLDLALVAKLAEALPPRARLILLGDKDQLASVETGAVFSSLSAARDGALRDAVVWLEHSYRFGAASGIGRLARLVNAGDAPGAAALLSGGAWDDLAWQPLAPGAEDFARRLFPGYGDYLATVAGGAEPAQVLRAFERYRVLCALRDGPRGTVRINEALAGQWRAALGLAGEATWYAGRPVLVTRNDYVLRVFNGDIGITLPDGSGNLLVYFPTAEGGVRALAPGRLPACDTAFAMTVHKAQGSEFERIDLVLPEGDCRVLTRELIYTALTRARRSVGVWGDAAVLAAAISRQTRRVSGLGQRLRT
jgi:exodeoxyribonuclease V alpha subunit